METPVRKKKRLQPLSIRELFERTFIIYRENFAAFIVPVALITIPITAINSFVSYWTLDRLRQIGIDPTTFDRSSASNPLLNDPTLLNRFFSDLLGVLVVSLVVGLLGALITQVLINSLIVYITSENQLGRQTTLRQALTAVQGRLPTLAGGFIALGVILLGLTILLAIILFACGLGIGVLVYAGVILSAFLTPVLVLERVGVAEGISRAWRLGKARLWPAVALTLAASAFTFIIGLIQVALVSAFTSRASGSISVGLEVVQFILTAATVIIVTPFLPIGYTLLYYDARIRLEQLDTALSGIDKPEPRPADVESPHPSGPFMSSDDFVNLGILTAGTFVLILIYVAISFLGGGRGAL